MGEIEVKIERIRNLMESENLDGILLTRNDNFSWITGGGRGWVDRSSETSVGWILITRDGSHLLTNDIEAERLAREEVPEIFESHSCKWYEPISSLVEKISGSRRIGADVRMEGFEFVGDKVKRLRYVLTKWEIERVRKMGEELERTLESSLEGSDPDMTEFELGGMVEGELRKRGFEVPVVLVFSENSRKLYRHNLPRNVKLGRFFFVSICAGKNGLILSMTRSVSFGNPPEDLKSQHEKNAFIDAQMAFNTVEGRTLEEMFFIIKDIYVKNGFGEEFEKHHQGGIAGYRTREEKAVPGNKTTLEKGMLVAWNPTITGTKSEDTFVLGEDVDYLTFTSKTRWPELSFEMNGRTIKRPGIRVL